MSDHGFDALLGELAENDEERASMAHALRLLAYAAPPATPPPGLRERLVARLAARERPPAYEKDGFYFAHGDRFEWLVLPGNSRIKFIYQDASGARTALVEMPPDTFFPAHDHDHIEDLFVVEGDAWVAGVHMVAGDYCRAPAGTSHVDIRSGSSGVRAVVVSR